MHTYIMLWQQDRAALSMSGDAFVLHAYAGRSLFHARARGGAESDGGNAVRENGPGLLDVDIVVDVALLRRERIKDAGREVRAMLWQCHGQQKGGTSKVCQQLRRGLNLCTFVCQMDRYLENMLNAMSRLTMRDNCRVKGQDQGVGSCCECFSASKLYEHKLGNAGEYHSKD